MSDRYYNRDRNRPYENDFDEDYYGQGYGYRGYDRDFDYDRYYGMRNRGYYGGSGYGPGRYGANRNAGYQRSYDETRGYGYNPGDRYNAGYGYNPGYGYNRSYGYPSGPGWRDYDYDYDYGPDVDRWYGNAGRGYSGRYETGRGDDYRGGYSRGTNRNRYGTSSNYGYNRGYGASEIPYDRDIDNDFDYDYDYEDDFYYNEPSSWSYQEIWLIPGPFSGVGPENYQRSDERIREDINERLTRHGRLNARDLQVQVNKGEVTLTGTVDKRNDKRTAEDVAASVYGVMDVHNQIKVQGRQKNSGKEQQRQSPESRRERASSGANASSSRSQRS